MDLDTFIQQAKDMTDEELEEALLEVRANRRQHPEREKKATKVRITKPTPQLELSDEELDELGDL